MARAAISLTHATVAGKPRPGWAHNGARKLSVFVVITHGNRMYPKAPLFYDVVFFGQAANGLLEAIDKGTFKQGTQFSCYARVEKLVPFTSKRTGQQEVLTRVHVVESELTHWWEGPAAAQKDEDGPEDEA